MAGYLGGGYPIDLASINSVFDGRGNNLYAYRGTTWYTAAGGSGTFPSGTISFSDFFGKGPNPAVTISLSSVEANEPYEGLPPAGGEPGEANLIFNSNGTWNAYLGVSSSKSGNWATPTTAGVGAGYWIRFTRTAFVPNGFGNDATGTTGWLQLNSGFGQGIFVTRTSGPGVTFAVYTIQIATDSGGSNIVATAVNIDVSAQYY
jgi:hypothetical protein